MQALLATISVAVDGIQGTSHALADLPDLGKELCTMSKDDEDVLAHGLLLGRIIESLVDFSIVHVEVAAKNAPEDALEDGHLTAVDGSCDKLEIESAVAVVLATRGVESVGLDIIEKGSVCIVDGSSNGILAALCLVEKDGSFTKDVLCLLELLESLLERFVGAVHLAKTLLVLAQLDRQFVHQLWASKTIGTGTNADERQSTFERSDWHALFFHLRIEEANAPLHLVQPPNISDERALKRRNVRVEILEHNISQLSKLLDGGVSSLGGDIELDQRHGR